MKKNQQPGSTSECWTSLPLVEHTFPFTPRHQSKPNIRTTATNGDFNATTEAPTAATAATASGADENHDDPNDEHKYVNTETYKNIEFKMGHIYDLDNQCSKQLLNATNVITKLLPNTRFKK